MNKFFIYITIVLLAVSLAAWQFTLSKKESQPSTIQPSMVTDSFLSAPTDGLANKNTASDQPSTVPNPQHTDSTGRALKIMDTPNWKRSGLLIDHLPQLKKAADAGDIDSKYILAENLQYCFYAPLDDEALQTKLDTVATYSDAGEAADQVIEKYTYCQHITQTERSQFYHYLADAAQLGSVAAQARFSGLTAEFYMQSQGFKTIQRDAYIAKRDAFNQQKLTFLTQASLHGNEMALMTLSNLHHTQQTGKNSLAHSYALNRLLMDITQSDEVYNRYAYFEQRQYPQLSENDKMIAEERLIQWRNIIDRNGTLYPHPKFN
ncbi:hypothetical protein PULV_a0327 [Pseudoalteromonas ulvae UL12]|uniref:hypothetical protein n=1 Tax=Pseudoalteromonas ulvae TaxID=107327 RepID=UPI00186B8649|nr:hypothetical protein [Pseudoalteromonas ulvae]MBE0362765.1 hypothetical protein [Pseudoalteromonas ulvae UL12]